VLTPAYNAAATIGATLASVREQTLPDHEHLVVDAGSSDDSLEVIAQAAREDPRIRLLRSSEPLPAPVARNAGLAEIRSELVALLDADDLSLPHRHETQLEALRGDPALVAVGGLKLPIDRAGLPLPMTAGDLPIPTTPACVRWILPLLCPTVASTTVFRTAALRAVGGFDPASPWADDYAILPALADLGPLAVLPIVVSRYRHHGPQLSNRNRLPQHLEVALLRQRVAATRLGRLPSLASVLAWSEPRFRPSPSMVEAALHDLRALVEGELARSSLACEDRQWIQREGERRLSLLAERHAAATSPLTATAA
jgi:glycosyltransferase involved in cell wall biosynthesis